MSRIRSSSESSISESSSSNNSSSNSDSSSNSKSSTSSKLEIKPNKIPSPQKNLNKIRQVTRGDSHKKVYDNHKRKNRSRSRQRSRSRSRSAGRHHSSRNYNKRDRSKERRYNRDSKSIERDRKVDHKPSPDFNKEEQVVIKGRGAIKKDYSSSLLGWGEDDYDKINERLLHNGKKLKESFYNRRNDENEEHPPSKNQGKIYFNVYLVKGWRHDKFEEINKRKLRGSPTYGN